VEPGAETMKNVDVDNPGTLPIEPALGNLYGNHPKKN
jgi:hypothetical protein